MSEIPVVRFAPRYGSGPRLVPVMPEQVVVDGQALFALKTEPKVGEPLVLSPEALAISRFFDGSRDLRSVQHAIYSQYGQLLYIERIHELAMALHRAGLFEKRTPPPAAAPLPEPTPAALPTSTATDVRPMMHAGNAYDADPTKLRATLDALFSHPDGPGLDANPAPRPILGLVAPHIDLHRGGPVYAHAYKTLAEGSDADLFVVLGTAHGSPPNLFSATRASYETPFGPVPTDLAALEILSNLYGPALFADEAAHRDEHSIELQALYLRYLYGDRPITMLPILCSSLYPAAAAGKRPDEEPEMERFLAALGEALRGRKVCIIAAADLSHVGLLYGDARGPTPDELGLLARRDLDSLTLFARGDLNAFFDHVGADGDTRRVCGLTPMYTLLRLLGGAPGRLLKYAQWFGPDDDSAVTYAAAVIEAS